MTTIKPVFMFCVPTSVLATITSSTIGTVPVFVPTLRRFRLETPQSACQKIPASVL